VAVATHGDWARAEQPIPVRHHRLVLVDPLGARVRADQPRSLSTQGNNDQVSDHVVVMVDLASHNTNSAHLAKGPMLSL
jgi:hypothetical protein